MAKVLIVEDDTDIRTAYVFALTQAGFEVIQAPDGAEAIQYFKSSPPDVVLLDMLMPSMSGIEFLQQIQVASQYPKTVIIAFSNIDTPAVVQQAKDLGVSDYVIKVNMTPHTMVDLVQQRLRTKSQNAASTPPHQPDSSHLSQ